MNRREIIRLALITPIAVIFKPRYGPLDYLADGTAYIEIDQDNNQRLAYVHRGIGYEFIDPLHPSDVYKWSMAKSIQLPQINP